VEEISLRAGQPAFTAAAIGAGMTVGEPIFLPDPFGYPKSYRNKVEGLLKKHGT
jgi:hypothetical protein